MANQRGVLAKAYRNTNAAFATPTWNEVPLFNDLTVGREWSTSPVVSRESQAEKEAPSTYKPDVQGNVRTLQGDTDYEAIYTAHVTGAALDMLFLTGPNNVNSENGVRCEWLVKGFSQDQAASVGHMYDSFSFVPHGLSVNPVQYAVVTNNAPVFTAM